MSFVKGRIHSFQSLGTLDGPGVRFVVFLQGCNLRCGCCHNPDTWDCVGGTLYSPEEIITKVIRYREYFKNEGGLTVSGGEPLLQADFVHELFTLCHKEGINTCLDTSGSIWNPAVEQLLEETDRVLLDIKYTNEEQYRENVGFSFASVLDFLSKLNERRIPVTLRQVVIPTLNDNEENILALKSLGKQYSCVDKTELLPFRKICQMKYDNMRIPFRFGHLPEPSPNDIQILLDLLSE